MATLVIGIAVIVLLAVALLIWVRRRARPPRPLETTRITLYSIGAPDRFIGIVTGDIRRVRCAEAWVNPENTTMQMARFDEFSVSSIIRYEGARRDGAGRVTDDLVARELTNRLAGRTLVPAGTAIVTGAGELRRHGVRHVVHVASVQGEPGAGFRQVREIGRCVTNALTELDRINDPAPVESILFPLLGTGHGGGELRATVNALLGAVIDYFAAVPTTRITNVFLLAYTDRELKACSAAFRAAGLRPAMAPIPRIPVPAADHEPVPLVGGDKRLQVGFVLDVVEFGRRSAPDRELVQSRLSTMVTAALADAGVALDVVDHQWTGDGLAAVLPTDIDPARVLADLIRAIHRRLTDTNHLNQDRIRLRMAAGVGLVGRGATGFAGTMIVDISRLIDSAVLRTAIREQPESDLALLISDQLHAHLVRPGYLHLPGPELHRVDVALKEFNASAWLWVAPIE